VVKLGKQDTMERNIVSVDDKNGDCPLELASAHRTDAATIKLLARENPGGLYYGLKYPLEHNKKNTAVVSLLRKCLADWEHGNISALIDLCGESGMLLSFKD